MVPLLLSRGLIVHLFSLFFFKSSGFLALKNLERINAFCSGFETKITTA
jgi:hypothetical protein